VNKKPLTRGGYSPARGLQNTNPQWIVAPVEKKKSVIWDIGYRPTWMSLKVSGKTLLGFVVYAVRLILHAVASTKHLALL